MNTGVAQRRQFTELPVSGQDSGPAFTTMLLFLVICLKPLADAFYDFSGVKYGYMAVLAFSAMLSAYGQLTQGKEADQYSPSGNQVFYLWLISTYFAYMLVLLVSFGSTFQEIFKIISPFIFFFLVAPAADKWLLKALAFGSALTIIVNAALLPTEFGWVNWGTVHTFKGFYYFKTDLAYALTFSVLICAMYARYVMSLPLAGLIALAGLQILLANSRLNYLAYALVVVFIALKSGLSLRTLVVSLLLLCVFAAMIMFFYDPSKLLGFDTSNEAAFTQGRSLIWERLFDSFSKNDVLQWLFGRGMFSDLILSYESFSNEDQAHDAHNEYLHIVYTQGIVGTALYLSLWWAIIRGLPHDMPRWTRGTGLIAVLLFLLQGMTAVISSFATKTWPLAMVFLALRALANVSKSEQGIVRDS